MSSESESIPFIYKIIEHKVKDGDNFTCLLRGNMNDEESILRWLKQFSSNSKTNWILRSSNSSEKSKYAFSRNYICQHSSFRKTSKKEKATQKNKDCKASLKIRIKYNTRHTRYQDPYVKEGLCAVININFQHSHLLNVAEAWGWLQRTDETRETFIKYFNSGMSPADAWRYHEDLLLAEGAEKLADASVNPPKHWIYYLHNLWRQNEDGGARKNESVFKQKALKETGFIRNEVHEVLDKILKNVVQNLNPGQQTSNVLNDSVHRDLQDTTISDVTSNVLPSLHTSSVAPSVSPTNNVSDVALSVLPGINLPQIAPRSVIKDVCILPKAKNAVKNSSTIQTALNNGPYTLPLISRMETYTLPVISSSAPSSLLKLSDVDCSTLPIVSSSVQNSSKIWTIPNNIPSNLPIVSTVVKDTITTQTVSKTVPYFIIPQKTSNVAKLSKTTEEISQPVYNCNTKQKTNVKILPKPATICGRRIIDFDYFFKTLIDVNQHSKSGCNLNDIIIVAEIKRGMCTGYELQCKVCDFNKVIWSEYPNKKKNVNSDMMSAMFSTTCSIQTINKLLAKLKLPTLDYSFYMRKRRNMLKKSQATTEQDSNFSTVHRKTSKELGKNFELRSQSDNAAHLPVTLPQKTYQKASQKLGKIFVLKPQTVTDQAFTLPQKTYEKASEKIGKTFELKSQATIHQAFTLPVKTYEKTTTNLEKSTERKPQSNTVQECISSPSKKSKMFERVDSSGLIVDDIVEIKEEINDSDYENESEAIMLQETAVKEYEDKLIDGKEQESVNMIIIKQEINSDVDDENLTGAKTNEMETLLKESYIEYDDQAKQMLSLPKKVRMCEDKMTIDQKQIKTHKTLAIQNDSNLVEPKFNDMEMPLIPKLSHSDNQPKAELSIKKCRTSRIVVNQGNVKLDEKGDKQKFDSAEDCERLIKTKFSSMQSTMNKKNIISCNKAKSENITSDKQVAFAVHQKSGNSLCATTLNNPANTKQILTTVPSKERKFFKRRSETDEKPAAASTNGGKKVFLIALQCMPKTNENNGMITSQIPQNLATGCNKDVSSAISLSGVPTLIQQPVNVSNNDPAPASNNNLRFIGRGNTSFFTLPGGAPKGVSDPVPPKTHIDQSNQQLKRPRFYCDACNINFAKYESLDSHKKSYCIKRFKLPPSSTVTNHTLISNSLQPTHFNHINQVTSSSKSHIEELLSAMAVKRSFLEASMKTALDAQYIINLHKSAQALTQKSFKELDDALNREKVLMPEATLEEKQIISENRAQALIKAEAAYMQEKNSAAAVEQALCRQKSAIEATLAATGHEQTALVSALRDLKMEVNQNCFSSIFQTQCKNLSDERSFNQEKLIDTTLSQTTDLKPVSDNISSKLVPVHKTSWSNSDIFIKQEHETGTTSHFASHSEKLSPINSEENKALAVTLEILSDDSCQSNEINTAISSNTTSLNCQNMLSHDYFHPQKVFNLDTVTSAETSLISSLEYNKKSVPSDCSQPLKLRDLNVRYFSENINDTVCHMDRYLPPSAQSQEMMDISKVLA